MFLVRRYLYFGAYPLIFQGRYHWNAAYSGLAFIGIGIGVVLSFLTAGYSNKLYIQLKEKRNKGDTYPEGRLPLAIVAALLAPGSIFWFAWSGFASVHWIVPVLSGVPFGWSMVILFVRTPPPPTHLTPRGPLLINTNVDQSDQLPC